MSQKFIDGNNLKRAIDYLVDGTIPIANSNLAPVYDSTKPYKIGNLLTYLGKQYYCIADAPAGTLPTNTTYFEEKSVADIIEMIKAGTIPVGLSDMAKNLTPYSEDSGAIQDTPFISQETGTANNSVIVTTGDKAKQLEKLGNAVVVNDHITNGNFANTSSWTQYYGTLSVSNNEGTITINENQTYGAIFQDKVFPTGHKVLLMCEAKIGTATGARLYIGGAEYVETTSTSYTPLFLITTATSTALRTQLRAYGEGGQTAVFRNAHSVDLTQWFNGDVPQDLLDNPSHWSWYYNGSLSNNAGSIEHGNGVKLVCTRGRNLFNGVMELAKCWTGAGQYVTAQNNFISTSYKSPVVPNTKYAITCVNLTTNNLPLYIVEFDSHKNFIRRWENPIYMTTAKKYKEFTVGADTWFIAFQFYREPAFTSLAEVTPIDLSTYYTPEQGGEGYGLHYDYEEPDIIDTGSEQLGAFDKKTHDGVITRATVTNTYDGTENWVIQTGNVGDSPYFYLRVGAINSVVQDMAKSDKLIENPLIGIANTERGFRIFNSTYNNEARIVVRPSWVTSESTLAEFKTWIGSNNLNVEYQSANPTTEQGSSFRQYANINDYGIMYWLDANDELVSIPQGCKIQYPVNYKGFIDDAYMLTNGDASNLSRLPMKSDSRLSKTMVLTGASSEEWSTSGSYPSVKRFNLTGYFPRYFDADYPRGIGTATATGYTINWIQDSAFANITTFSACFVSGISAPTVNQFILLIPNDEGVSTVEQLRTWLASHNVTISYEASLYKLTATMMNNEVAYSWEIDG